MVIISFSPVIIITGLILVHYGATQSLDQLPEENAKYTLKTFYNTLKQYFSVPVDVVFVLDESGSVGQNNYKHEIKFCELMARLFVFSPSIARAALVAFGSSSRLHFNYLSSGNGDMCNFMSSLGRVDYIDGGTNTESGLLMAKGLLQQGRSNSKKIIVLLSDGGSNMGNPPIPVAQSLKNSGIIIFCVGVAGAIEAELLGVASSPSHLYIVKDFAYIVKVNDQLRADIVNQGFVKQSAQDCNSVCQAGISCCDVNADCFCGSDGAFSCQCRVGYIGHGTKGTCSRCPKGQYNSGVGNGQCLDCPLNSNTDKDGANSISDCKCDPGFQGNPTNGISCEPNTCSKLVPPVGGHLDPAKCGNKVKDVCNFYCEPPYCPYDGSVPNCVQNTSRIRQEERKCLATGNWDGRPFSCKKASCSPITNPQNGIYNCDSKELEIGSQCALQCDPGFVAHSKRNKISDVTWTCLPSGMWNKPLYGTCKAEGCKSLNTTKLLQVKPASCGITDPQPLNTKCQYYCSPGYKVVKYVKTVETDVDGIRNCEAKGWSGGPGKFDCKDNTPPVITCPKDMVVFTAPAKSVSKGISWNLTMATDNDGLPPVTKLIHPPFIKGKPKINPPYTFPIGVTKLTYEATDASKLTARCSFTVTVIDDESPKVKTCPKPIEEFSMSKEPFVITWTEPEFEDNSGKIHSLTKNHKSGDLFEIDKQYDIVYTAMDESNNMQQCNFSVVAKSYRCTYKKPPKNGFVNCKPLSRVAEKCTLGCNKNYAIATNDSLEYECHVAGGVGVWKPDTLRPDCSATTILYISTPEFNIAHPDVFCDDPDTYQHLIDQFAQSFCVDGGFCDPADVKGRCEPPENKRRKRDADDSTLKVSDSSANTILYISTPEFNIAHPDVFCDDPDTYQHVIDQFVQSFCVDGGFCDPADVKGRCGPPENKPTTILYISTPEINIAHPDVFCDDPDTYQHVIDQFVQSFCVDGGFCDPADVKGSCEPPEDRRRKRDADDSTIKVSFVIDSSSVSTQLGTSTKSEKEVRDEIQRILRDKAQIISKLKGFEQVTIEIDNTPIKLCGVGKVFKNASCVNCPVGTYHSGDFCERCGMNTFQDEEASVYCKQCPTDRTTLNVGTNDIKGCIAKCGPGHYSATGLEQCIGCPIGTYQELYQQSNCKSCPSKTTTWLIGARDTSQCTIPCSPGTASSTGFKPCYLCPIGSYQSKHGQINCTPCGGTLSTRSEGMKSQSSCTDVNVCDPQPCQHGGFCSRDSDYEYRCDCVDGIVGPRCELNLDDCTPYLCHNNATCVDEIDKYSCKCHPGFRGPQCTENIDDCFEGACWNDGTCVDGINSYTCDCEKGFSGKFCQISTNDCKSNPCHNGGTCLDFAKGYECCCPKGFSGYNCEIQDDECKYNNLCRQGSQCLINDSGSAYCVCQTGYTGSICDVNIDDCSSLPCKNNGYCRDLINDYSCTCLNGFDGRNCEIVMDAYFDAYFSTARTSNYALIPTNKDLFSVTVAFWMKATQSPTQRGTPVSYSYKSRDNGTLYANALTWYDTNKLILYIHNQEIRTTITPSADTNWHHYAITLDSLDGKYVVFKDGVIMLQGSNIAVGVPLWRGFFILGQEQDILAGGFSSAESFLGSITQFNVWDYAMSAKEIQQISTSCGYVGNVVGWPNVKDKFSGDDVVLSASNLCGYQIKKCGLTAKECFCQENGINDDKLCERHLDSCNNQNCHHSQQCIDTGSGAYCNCSKGYTGDLCQYDINECLENNGNCSHQCINTVGSYKCKCRVDFVLANDSHVCVTTKQCSHNGRLYSDSEKWIYNCKDCKCNKGNVECTVQKCPKINCEPEGNRIQIPGECCPNCIPPTSKRCTITANNELTSFDSNIVHVTTICHYILAQDCSNGSVSIYVQKSPLTPQLKTLSIRSHCSVFDITAGGNLIIDGLIKKIPHLLNEYVRVDYVPGHHGRRNRPNIIISLYNGMSILWTHTGLVMVMAPDSMRTKLCGLCGNHNGIHKDDLLMKDYEEADNMDDFLWSWRANQSEQCEARSKKLKTPMGLIAAPAVDYHCENGTVYNKCGPMCKPTCGGHERRNPMCFTKQCISGCHCPEGLVWSKRACIKPQFCPPKMRLPMRGRNG